MEAFQRDSLLIMPLHPRLTHPGFQARFLTSLDRFAALPSNVHRSVCWTVWSTPSRPTGRHWLSTMMDEELHLQPVQAQAILRSAVVITAATLVGHLIPLLPFVWLSRTTALIVGIVLSAPVLFGGRRLLRDDTGRGLA